MCLCSSFVLFCSLEVVDMQAKFLLICQTLYFDFRRNYFCIHAISKPSKCHRQCYFIFFKKHINSGKKFCRWGVPAVFMVLFFVCFFFGFFWSNHDEALCQLKFWQQYGWDLEFGVVKMKGWALHLNRCMYSGIWTTTWGCRSSLTFISSFVICPLRAVLITMFSPLDKVG